MSDDAFSEREQKLMAFAWQCFTEQPKLDIDKLAKLGGYTNPKSAANAWAAIKKKLNAQAAAAGADGDTTPKVTPKATPKKRAVLKKAASEETPAKKAKISGKKATESEEADDEGIDGLKKEATEEDSDDLT